MEFYLSFSDLVSTNQLFMLLRKEMSVFLADDDEDDCLFFQEALQELSVSIQLTTAKDGEQLMQLLGREEGNLPHALFLDLNMPRKNGFECLTEIRNNAALNNLAVVVFSTSFHQELADKLYAGGAQYYIRKPVIFSELKDLIESTLMLIQENMTNTPKVNVIST